MRSPHVTPADRGIEIDSNETAMAMSDSVSTLSDGDFHRITADVLSAIERQVDDWLQHDVIDIDTARTGGLLEMTFPDRSVIVINTQPPLHELWLAARSGGFHFRHVDGHWVDTKDGREFHARLNECASAQAGQPLTFSAA